MASFYDEMRVKERPHLTFSASFGKYVIFWYYGMYFCAEDIRYCIDKFLGNKLPEIINGAQISCLLLFLIIDIDMRKKIKQSFYDDFIKITPHSNKNVAILNIIMLDTRIILKPIDVEKLLKQINFEPESITDVRFMPPHDYLSELEKLIYLLKLHGLLVT